MSLGALMITSALSFVLGGSPAKTCMSATSGGTGLSWTERLMTFNFVGGADMSKA